MKNLKLLSIIVLLTSFTFLGILQAEKKEVVVPTDKDGIQRVDILAGEYFYDPNYIIVKVNVPVEIKIKKEPYIIPHNIAIKEPDAGIDFIVDLSKEPVTIKFTPKKIGKYPFYCTKKPPFGKSHRERGMEGIIEVRE
jgi:plastocyanin domain-containing protein